MTWDGTPITPTLTLTADNCYLADLSDAEAYFTYRLKSEAWDNASANDKAKALVQATRLLDALIFSGQKSDSDQAHAFPRTYEVAQAADARRRFSPAVGYVADGEVPQAVLDACCEWALDLLKRTDWDVERQRLQAAGVTDTSLGDASESYGGAAPRSGPAMPPEVWSLLKPWLARTAALR